MSPAREADRALEGARQRQSSFRHSEGNRPDTGFLAGTADTRIPAGRPGFVRIDTDGGVYCLPPSVTSREGSSAGFEDTLYPWLRACRETSAGDPTSPDDAVWQPGARCCRLTLIDDGPRVDEAARALARMPHEESRTAARDIQDWLASRQTWGGGDRIQDRMDHDAGSAAPTRRSDFGEQLQVLKEHWADDIEIDGSVESKNEPTTDQPVVLQPGDEFGEPGSWRRS